MSVGDRYICTAMKFNHLVPLDGLKSVDVCLFSDRSGYGRMR